MATPTVNALPYQKNDKGEGEVLSLEVKPPVGEPIDAVADYSGFTQKTDPAEIKLVRKLDRFIMVSLCGGSPRPSSATLRPSSATLAPQFASSRGSSRPHKTAS